MKSHLLLPVLLSVLLLKHVVCAQGTKKCLNLVTNSNFDCHLDRDDAKADCNGLAECQICERTKRVICLLCMPATLELKKCFVCTDPDTTPPAIRATCSGDPHIRLYDSGRYVECFTQGEFIMSKSDSAPKFELQARFIKDVAGVTVTTGMAVQQENFPKVQVSISKSTASKRTMIQGCPVSVYVEGVNVDVNIGRQTFGLGSVSVVASSSSISVAFDRGMSFVLSIWKWRDVGCSFVSLYQAIPGEYLVSAKILGLWGTPNGNPNDDTTTRDGTPLTIPDNPASESAYCKEHWCVKNESESLFSYEPGHGFADITQCNDPLPPAVPEKKCEGELLGVCGMNKQCCFDGNIGGIELAKEGLKAEVMTENVMAQIVRPAATRVTFTPKDIKAGESTIVRVVMDVSSHPPATLKGLQKFIAQEIDPLTGVTTGIMFDLLDNGLASNGDELADDNIFSNKIPFKSDMGGVSLTFEIIPVIDGAQVRTSPLFLRVLEVIKVFTPAAGVVTAAPLPPDTISIGLLDGLEIKATFAWAMREKDIKIAVEHAGDIAGFFCFGFGVFVLSEGQSEGPRGLKSVLIRPKTSRDLGFWTGSTTVSFRAEWFQTKHADPVLLTTVMRNSATKVEIPGTELSTVIEPGLELFNDCADKEVAVMQITEMGANTKITLKKKM